MFTGYWDNPPVLTTLGPPAPLLAIRRKFRHADTREYPHDSRHRRFRAADGINRVSIPQKWIRNRVATGAVH